MLKKNKHFADAGCFFHAQKGVILLGEKKMCFSKKLLIAEFMVLGLMLWLKWEDAAHDWSAEICGWFAVMAVSTGFYYWKAKSENLVKMPIQMLKDLPEDMKEKSDPNQIIASVLGLKD